MSKAAHRLLLGGHQDVPVGRRQGRRQPGLGLLQAVGQVFQLLLGQLLLRGLVVVDVAQGQQAAGGVDDLAGPLLVGGQEHQHVGVLAEALAVLLQDAGDEFFGLLRQTVLGGPLVQVEDHQAQPWLVGHEVVVACFGVAEDTERGVADQVVQRGLGEVPHLVRLGADQSPHGPRGCGSGSGGTRSGTGRCRGTDTRAAWSCGPGRRR